MTIKRIPLLITVIATVFIHQSCAMQPPEEASLNIINETGKKIEIAYLQKGKHHEITLIHEQRATIGDFPTIEVLYVAPYGKVRGKLSLANLPGTFFKNNLLKNVKDLEIAHLNNQSAALTIKLGGEYLSYVVGQWLAGEVSPYQYEVTILKPEEVAAKEEKEEKVGLLIDHFPQVKDAVTKNKEVLPRYFLNVGEGASSEVIDEAHEQLRLIWQEKKDSPIAAEAELAREILEVLQEAYNKLQGIPDRFEVLVAHYQPVEEPKVQEHSLTEEEKTAVKQVTEAFSGELSDSE